MPDPVLRAEGFTYRYPEAPRVALDGISLELLPGTFTVLAGASGSGKSTLLRAACGLVPHFHGGDASGELEVGGMDVRHHGPADLARFCGTLLQDAESQVVMDSVRSEIALCLESRGEPAAGVARGVEEAALLLGVADLLERRTSTLSGGELQRVALAAAIAHRPALLVLDEPTAQLDPVAGEELVWLLRRLNEEWGTAVLLAEHRLERCLPAADRVVALDGGAVACDADPGDFLAWAAGNARGMATPLARLFAGAGLSVAPVSVKEAREELRKRRSAPVAAAPPDVPRASRRREQAALELCGVWHEVEDGPAVLRGIDLRVQAGERVALMGRNGAGKSTLLRHVKGLLEPTRGRVASSGEVALLLQNPGDYLVRERAVDEAGPEGLAAAGLSGRELDHPRDLSGGERQRLALEVVLHGERAAVVLLDEPTRGMDAAWKAGLCARVRELSEQGACVIVATHDTEFAAALADRVVLMGRGDVIADGPPAEVLAGGWHFSTEVARVLEGAALTPDEGTPLLAAALARSPEVVA